MEVFKEWFNHRNNKFITIGVVIVIIIGGWYIFTRPKHLDGNYSATINLVFAQSKDTLSFDGDKVTENQNGKNVQTGTYKIDGNNLEMNINNYTINATLSNDQKSFTLNSANGLASIANGTKYTKEDN